MSRAGLEKRLIQFGNSPETRTSLLKNYNDETLKSIQDEALENIIKSLDSNKSMDDNSKQKRPHLMRGIIINRFIYSELENRKLRLKQIVL